MSEFTYPLDGEQNYSAAQAGAFNGTRTSGVWSGDDNLSVKVSSATTLLLSKGLAWFTTDMYWGKVYCNTESIAFVPPAADAALDCIYRIILRWNKTANAVAAMLVAGELSSNPVAPQRNTSNEVFDLVLAEYYQTHGESQLNPAKLTDTRLDESLCGLMRDGVTRLPTETMYAQFEAVLASIQDELANIVGGTGFDPAPVRFENVVIAPGIFAAFEAEDTEETKLIEMGYEYRGAVALDGVLSSMFPYITLSLFDVDECGAGIANLYKCYNGGVYIYADGVPESNITALTMEFRKAVS